MASERPRRGRKPLVYDGEELRCTWRFEEEARAEGWLAVAGMDEVGRGALCGPVVACVVILGDGFDTDGIDDSKRLTALQREALSARIRAKARAFSVGVADPKEIDRLNILVSIAAASVVAKVERDAMMREYDQRYPGYGLGHNMGYAADDHREALRRMGPSEIHRRSFHGTQRWLF